VVGGGMAVVLGLAGMLVIRKYINRKIKKANKK